MPVWHEATRKWVQEGRLRVLAVIQEQHPDRCRLFAQWHGIEWPILHDPINVLNATAVPLFIAIDEHGIVRSTGPKVERFEAEFLAQQFIDDATQPAAPSLTPERQVAADQPSTDSPARAPAWQQRGDTLAIWRAAQQLDSAIAAYEQALRIDPQNPAVRFRLGVCLRMRHERRQGADADFSRAVTAWEQALAARPNQYIWRRRIQQYGPRLIKPYPFYDWVTRAEAEIRARGETPVSLAIRPSGAEVAAPSRDFQQVASQDESPDPEAKIRLDKQPLINVTVTSVPSRVEPGATARLHLTLVPDQSLKAHWNNEVEPLRLWIAPPDGVTIERQLLEFQGPPEAESREVRRMDVEVQVPRDAAGMLRLEAYALYYVCEDVGGVCQFLRQEIPLEIPITNER